MRPAREIGRNIQTCFNLLPEFFNLGLASDIQWIVTHFCRRVVTACNGLQQALTPEVINMENISDIQPQQVSLSLSGLWGIRDILHQSLLEIHDRLFLIQIVWHAQFLLSFEFSKSLK
ncbi:hypothetical protein XarbCFBP7610_17185 [Xanthomonas arboricola]|nr:hypothetical protein XarbCFBP7610_17185 [Xanthomonas arboricola]